VGRLRAVRKLDKPGELVLLSAADPLNLVGILTPEPRVPAVYRNRILLQDGLPIAALEGAEVRRLADSSLEDGQLKTLLARRSLRHPLEPHLRSAAPGEVAGLERTRDRVRNLHWSQARR
jgi:ATP-dependent Lhr-like helicase